MTKSARHFEAFADHTLLKHAILRAYLQSWAFKLLLRPGAGDVIYFVDGFSGPGIDGKGNPGSPVIASQIAVQVRRYLKTKTGRQVQLRVIAIEADPRKFRQLESQLDPFRADNPTSAVALHGTLSEHADHVVREIAGQPALFFLDPFGVKGLDASKYPAMLSGNHNEIFVLFDDVGAARLRGVVHAADPVERRRRALEASPSLFAELDAQRASELERAAQEKSQVVRRFGENARRPLSEALGDSSWEVELRGASSDHARGGLIFRFITALLDAGGRHPTVVYMRSETGGHKYCLVHISKSLSGYTAMKEAVSSGLSREDLSVDMRLRMREDLRVPMAEVVARVQERFGGRAVRWSAEKGQEIETVKRFLLEETDVFDFQCPEIKAGMKDRGWLRTINRLQHLVVPGA